jgi:S-adenosylmethionine decarboxylase
LYALGKHLLIELRECNTKILSDLKKVQDVLITAAKVADATIVEVAFHEFSPFDKAVAYLIEKFQSKNPSVVELKRGILSTKNEKLAHKVSIKELGEEAHQPVFSVD